jgi:CMP-N-acetylneuraminic acid synthetase
MYKIIGEIPARYGSKRVKHKNLRLMNEKPLIWYAIQAAKNSERLSEVYVNSESDIIGKVAVDNGVKFYKRDAKLATDAATSDEFNYDFIKTTKPDILVMINPVSPLIEGKDIDSIIEFSLENEYDTVIAIREEKLQAFCNNEPINFNPHSLLVKTQDIPPIQICTWSVCVWRAETFIKSYDTTGYAVFSGKVGFYPLSMLKSVKISTEEDFILAEALLKHRKKKEDEKV